MTFFRTILINLIIMTCCNLLPAAPETPVSIKTGTDRTTIHIGDPVNFYIVISYEKDIRLELPASGNTIGPFEIKDQNISDVAVSSSENPKKIINYTITTYYLGDIEIPGLEIGYIDRNNKQAVIKTEPVIIKVMPVKKLPNDTDDIRNLKEQVSLPTYWWLLILILLLLAGLGWLVYQKYWKTKKVKEEILPRVTENILSEDEEALEKIRQLGTKGYLENGLIKEYYFELNEIIRQYLHRRYDLITLERTSYEIIQDLKKLLVKDALESYIRFFNDTDMVKFAKYTPSVNEIKGITPSAVDLVQSTKRVKEIPHETL
ncbi:MAG: hypothetical protein PHF84_03340 [bacterium]|nr:hypothetical protein [bacterium]